MSELTSCNFCGYRRLQQKYGTDNVRLVTGIGEWRGWQVAEVKINGDWQPTAWFLMVTMHCVC